MYALLWLKKKRNPQDIGKFLEKHKMHSGLGYWQCL
jgi:hypothetical protein